MKKAPLQNVVAGAFILTNMSDEIDGYILTGGKSSRMGDPKGRLMLGGRSFVERISAALTGQTRVVFTVGDADVYPCLANVRDNARFIGGPRSSMTGLFSALSHAKTDWIFVVACDLPFVTGALFGRLAAARSNEFGANIPLAADGTPQPVCGLYRVAACRDVCGDSIERSDLSLRKLVQSVNAFQMPFDELRPLEGSDHFFRNVNTPGDLDEARALVENA